MNKFYTIVTMVAIFAVVYSIGCYAWMGAEWFFLHSVTFNRIDSVVACLFSLALCRDIIPMYFAAVKKRRGEKH